MLRKAHKSTGLLIVLLLSGSILGSYLGEMLHTYLPAILLRSFKVGVSPFTFNMRVLDVTFGFTINMNFVSILGMVAGFLIYRIL